MEDSRWLRLITAGLVLAAIVVGYFLITGRFTTDKKDQPKQNQQATRPVQQFQPSPTPSPTGEPGVSTESGQMGDSSVQNLPNTGFPIGLVGIFSASAMISGYYLRKYPK
ncbi:hypothetical protein HYW42_02260 [Candidatus Daviesbacteria bacterium]|nr:hypothetical protein [Candidatus Daviesbacteria bacterium]